MRSYKLMIVVLTASQAYLSAAQTVKPLILLDGHDSALTSSINDAIQEMTSSNPGLSVTPQFVLVDNKLTDKERKDYVCGQTSSSYSAVVDLTWDGVSGVGEQARLSDLPWLQLDVTNRPFIQAADSYLEYANATDAALIFQDQKGMNQSILYLLGNTVLRVVVMEGLENNIVEDLKKIRPTPTYYVIFAETERANQLMASATSSGLMTKDSWWTVVLTDGRAAEFNQASLRTAITVVNVAGGACCRLVGLAPDCTCPNDFQLPALTARQGTKVVLTAFVQMSADGRITAPKALDCGRTTALSDTMTRDFSTRLEQAAASSVSMQLKEKRLLPSAAMDLWQMDATNRERLGSWSFSASFVVDPNHVFTKIKRHFKIGVIVANPWTFMVRNSRGDPVRDPSGRPVYGGYCIELLDKLADKMEFNYDLVFPADGAFGAKNVQTSKWSGLVGDLVEKDTDIVIAALTMTSEREEVIDFVAPYFDQSGISIVVRKQEPEYSIFRFMTVLKKEVWFSIVGALVVTGLMIWVLDKFSPYSAQNNPDNYPYPCRTFTLKESFWFALTSFTPQGGGEAPKALSGRTLVAAYWLFVVLMLATFTANLAAFLTVERMQTTVKSLEELARQSRIEYTVVANSSILEYFQNMATAEEELFRVWKEMTLNSTTDQAKYRVWDYPIKEQYTHILNVIKKTGMVRNDSVGFDKVLANKKGEYAFIHDASIVRYEVYRNCNLTQVGEPFAEQPYAIAVQQGSHLQDEISKNILELQKDRYFEALTAKYWNASLRGDCPSRGDSEGITLHSLGGVFIATLAGLVLALITLAGEVVYHKNKANTQVTSMEQKKVGVSVINVNPHKD
ncbi:LOW QUALITY PROTEIN: ionotropic receptor 25a-like [Pollicipes pollicipes]|uniref:LOW QUALITY PROTEIN: ionotropic receptor 25a-like n=1 Tax=Pollicipes pollicipes TaxID=41117 RepID=UPI0018854B0B|nr:LOW QUALITY PROTEIN: ionotropic receptor 25a-like [Pollicipes pollicipes]